MEMTNAQFNGFIRFVIDALEDADPEKQNAKLQKVIQNLLIAVDD